PAQVPAHPLVDLGLVWGWVRLEKRDRREGLAGLAVPALHDVSAVPSVADGIDYAPGGSLYGGHSLADGALSSYLARLHVATVDQNRARGAEAGAAPELRAAHLKYVSEHPEQRSVGMAIVDV